MDPARLPPVSRRLDFILQALEDICSRLDKIAEGLTAARQRQEHAEAGRPLITAKEAAKALGVGLRTLRALAGREIPYVKIGRRLSFVPNDLEQFVAKHRRDWGSSRWKGHGRQRYGDQQKYDDAYLERLNRVDPSERMPPLDDAFAEALKASDVALNARRALRLAGINTLEKARTYRPEEILRLKGIGPAFGPRILRAIGLPAKGPRRPGDARVARPIAEERRAHQAEQASEASSDLRPEGPPQ